MSAPKHTPGPWKLEYPSADHYNVYGNSPLELIALGTVNKVGHAPEEASANAALIARAPDLLVELDKERQLVEEASCTIAVLHEQLNDAAQLTKDMSKMIGSLTAERDKLRAELAGGGK